MTLTNKLKEMRRREEGFTIVELLIVIIVIAILAALVITAYVGIQQRARDSERQSDVRALVNAAEIYAADNDGQYPTCAEMLDGTVQNLEDDAKVGPGGDPATASFNTTGAPTSETESQYYCANDGTNGVLFGYFSEENDGPEYRGAGEAPDAPTT